MKTEDVEKGNYETSSVLSYAYISIVNTKNLINPSLLSDDRSFARSQKLSVDNFFFYLRLKYCDIKTLCYNVNIWQSRRLGSRIVGCQLRITVSSTSCVAAMSQNICEL